jgi:hypothetical protein
MRILIPLVFVVGSSVFATHRFNGPAMEPPKQVQQADQSGQTFIAYANAIAAFLNANPSFVGSVTAAQLAAQGTPFSAAFLATAGNKVTAFGSTGRTVVSYAALPTGAINTISQLTEGDASFGTSSGNTWTSIAPGASALSLPSPVASGSVVSVIQLGL